MGFKLNINNILRQNIKKSLEIGKEYSFEKEGSNLIADDIQIWLTRKNWTPLADIQVTSQTREDNKTKGRYVVKYIYSNEEQQMLKKIFKRMYGW